MHKADKISDKAKRFLVQTCTEAVRKHWFSLPLELHRAWRITVALEHIRKRWPEMSSSDVSDKPVFLFSAGWRSGSTLLQRLIISSGEVAMWGEPLGESAIIPRLAYSLTPTSQNWPMDEYMDQDPTLNSLSNKWIANLMPAMTEFQAAHRAFLNRWLAMPTKRQYGVERWGLKEVRLTIDHARYLRWLYPNAKFVFLCRNLFDAYRSWRGNRWGSEWPDYFTWSPIAFARHWKLLADGFLEGHRDVDGYLIRLEDLVSGEVDLSDLACYLEVDGIDEGVLERKIGMMHKKAEKKKLPLIFPERKLLTLVAGRTMKTLRYSTS